MLRNKIVYLRALEPNDLDFIFKIENDTNIWHLSNTQSPYSKFILKEYIKNSHQDIYQAKQLRLVICCCITNATIGLIDLFDFSPNHNRTGIGIVIAHEKDKQKGFAKNALEILIKYCFNVLDLHQIYANIEQDNQASIALFSKLNFELIGVKKNWNKRGSDYIDEGMYQLLNKK